MIRIETPRLIIRNWEERDRGLFHRINSDEQVMAFFPFRRTREQADAFMETMRAANEERGYGFAALELRATGECVGFAGLYADSIVPSRPENTVEIGWRLAPEYWGRGYITEAAEALLDFGFSTLGIDEIVSFAVWNNDRSTSVMQRIGMTAEPESDFDHPRVPNTHPELKRHAFYRITREEWLGRKEAR